MGRSCSRMEEGRSTFKVLTGTPTGKKPLERPRRRWKTVFEWISKKWVSIRGIGLIRLRIGINWRALVNATFNLWVPWS